MSQSSFPWSTLDLHSYVAPTKPFDPLEVINKWQEDKRANQQLAEQARHNQAEEALTGQGQENQRNIAELHYGSLAEDRAAAREEKAGAREEGNVSRLLEQYRKYKSSGRPEDIDNMDIIANELVSKHGFKREEQPTALATGDFSDEVKKATAQTASPPPAAPTTPGTPPPLPGRPLPPPQSKNGPTPQERAQLEAGVNKTLTGLGAAPLRPGATQPTPNRPPLPGQPLAAPAAPPAGPPPQTGTSAVQGTQAAAAPTQAHGGKFILRDDRGNVVDIHDAPVEHAKLQAEMAAPWLMKANDPSAGAADRKASQDAAVHAAGLVGTMPPEKIEADTREFHRTKLRYYQKMGMGGPSTGGTGLAKGEAALMAGSDEETHKAISEVEKDEKVPEARKAVSAMARAEEGLSGLTGVEQKPQLDLILKEVSGRVTNLQYKQVLGGAGVVAQIQQGIERVLGEGSLDQETLRGLRNLIESARRTAQATLTSAGEQAYKNRLASARAETEETKEFQARRARAFFTGESLNAEENPALKKGPAAKEKKTEAPKKKSMEESLRNAGVH